MLTRSLKNLSAFTIKPSMRAFSTRKECDYLVVGGGAMGLAFTDELLT